MAEQCCRHASCKPDWCVKRKATRAGSAGSGLSEESRVHDVARGPIGDVKSNLRNGSAIYFPGFTGMIRVLGCADQVVVDFWLRGRVSITESGAATATEAERGRIGAVLGQDRKTQDS
jgi:hypothetical protein